MCVSMIVPMGVLAALTGVWLTGGDNNIFTQIGLVVLVGLSAKNAILIVEFARELEFEGRTPREAAIEASRLRLRPILMPSCWRSSAATACRVMPSVIPPRPQRPTVFSHRRRAASKSKRPRRAVERPVILFAGWRK